MSTRLAPVRSIAALMLMGALLAGTASAQVAIRYKSGGADREASATGVSFNIGRYRGFDPETGQELPESAPEQISLTPLMVNRVFDANSPAFVGTALSGERLGDVLVTMGTGANRAEWTLKDAQINNYGTFTLDGASQSESFEISYSRAILRAGGRTTEIIPPQQ